MSQRLISFVAPATDPLSTMKDQFGHLSASLNSFNQQLQRQAAHLISSNGNADFQGLTANAFSKAAEYYLNISHQHSSILEQAATITQTCITQLSSAVDTANGKNLNDILVNYVLDRVTLDEVLQHGSPPVEAVLNELRQKLTEMTQTIQKYANDVANAGKSLGQGFKDLFTGNFGAAGHDFQQSWNDFAASMGDLGQFLLETGEFVWESVFDLTAAALIQCAQDIWQAMSKCTRAISALVTKIAQLISGISKDEQTIMNDVKAGNFNAALSEYLKDFINPELKAMGLEQVSASQLEEIIKQTPGLWEWLQHLPWWAWIAAIGVIVAGIIGTFVVRMFIIQSYVTSHGGTATKGQIWSLLWKGYSNKAIESLLLTTNVQNSEGMTRTITNPDGSLHTFTAHTIREHVGISDPSMIGTTSTIDLLHRLSTTATVYYDAHLLQQEKDILCILFSPDLEGTSDTQDDFTFQALVYLVTFDLQKRQREQTLIYNCYAPAENPTRHTLIRYDASQKCWLLAQQQGDWYIGLRTATEEADGSLILSPLCLLDRDESQRGFHLILDLEIHNDRYRFLSHKAVVSHLKAPVVSDIDLVLHRPGWNSLEERHVIEWSGQTHQDRAITRWQQWLDALQHKPLPTKGHHLLDNILLPEQVSFDPGTIGASQASEVEIVKQAEIAAAENAMSIADQHTRLLVLCSPETWVMPNERPRSATEREQTGEQWRIWLTGWERSELTYKWTYAPDMGLPTDPHLLAHEYPRWPDAEVAAIAGPLTHDNQPTFVATMAMQDAEAVLSHGVCLTHEGQVVQVCNAALGRYPSLCLCQQTVLGVDRLEAGWRLWNWAVLDEATLRTSLILDSACQRAFVRSQPDADHFWLIEELPDGVRVGLRDARTLVELTPAEVITGTKLLGEQADRPLEPHRNGGLIPHNETLLLLLTGEQEELLLYQAQ